MDWTTFQGEAAPHDFDPNRFMNWRFYWDYSGGNVFENMVHQVIFGKILDLKIPRSVTMGAGNYSSPEMEVPDTHDVAMDHGTLLFTWNSMFGNRHYGEGHDMLLAPRGRSFATSPIGSGMCPSPRSPNRGTDDLARRILRPTSSAARTAHDPTGGLFDCVPSRKQPNCPFELGFRSAITCRMALTAFREGRRVTWDAERGEIV